MMGTEITMINVHTIIPSTLREYADATIKRLITMATRFACRWTSALMTKTSNHRAYAGAVSLIKILTVTKCPTVWMNVPTTQRS